MAWGWLALIRLGVSFLLPIVGGGDSRGLRVTQGKFSGGKSGYCHPKKGK